MVRFKARWMLVRLEFAKDHVVDKRTGKVKWFPTREDFLKATRNSLQEGFGASVSDAIMEVQVRFCDATSGLLLVRASRRNYPLVRASITLLTSIQLSPTEPSRNRSAEAQQPRVRVVASVVSVHGSLRTTKAATIHQLKNHCRKKLQGVKKQLLLDGGTTNPNHLERRHYRMLEEGLAKIRSLE